jgi:hypothetical protein
MAAKKNNPRQFALHLIKQEEKVEADYIFSLFSLSDGQIFSGFKAFTTLILNHHAPLFLGYTGIFHDLTGKKLEVFRIMLP